MFSHYVLFALMERYYGQVGNNTDYYIHTIIKAYIAVIIKM
jgi:hypothetical protein